MVCATGMQVAQAMQAARQAMQSGVRLQQEGVSPTDVYAIHKEVHTLSDFGDQGGCPCCTYQATSFVVYVPSFAKC